MYAHEEDEWRREVHAMTEWDRAIASEHRWAAFGIGGDREDARETA